MASQSYGRVVEIKKKKIQFPCTCMTGRNKILGEIKPSFEIVHPSISCLLNAPLTYCCKIGGMGMVVLDVLTPKTSVHLVKPVLFFLASDQSSL